MHGSYLVTLPGRLAAALSAGELEMATRTPGAPGITRSSHTDHLRVDLRLLPSPVPRVTLDLDPPADARELCRAGGVERPVAVSPDVHQRTWRILEAGAELPDPHGRRIASDVITAGRWDIVPLLSERPSGELPDVVSGASPAYELHERGGAVRAIEIAPTVRTARILEPGDPDAQALVAGMSSAYPAWRGSGDGWSVDPAASFVAVYDEAEPVAGAALMDAGDGLACASQLCLVPERRRPEFGAALLDALEAVARERRAIRLRLRSGAFLLGDDLPHARYGYAIGPPYEGDTDVEVWTEKELFSYAA